MVVPRCGRILGPVECLVSRRSLTEAPAAMSGCAGNRLCYNIPQPAYLLIRKSTEFAVPITQ